MRTATIRRDNPIVRRASTLNQWLTKQGFRHDLPISAMEYVDDDYVAWIEYQQDDQDKVAQ